MSRLLGHTVARSNNIWCPRSPFNSQVAIKKMGKTSSTYSTVVNFYLKVLAGLASGKWIVTRNKSVHFNITVCPWSYDPFLLIKSCLINWVRLLGYTLFRVIGVVEVWRFIKLSVRHSLTQSVWGVTFWALSLIMYLAL